MTEDKNEQVHEETGLAVRGGPCPEIVSYFGAGEATIFSKRGSPRSGSQKGCSFSVPSWR